MLRLRVIPFYFLLTLALASSRNKFRRCSDSPFCKRYRTYVDAIIKGDFDRSRLWRVVAHSVTPEGHLALNLSNVADSSTSALLDGTIQLLDSGSFRLRIDENIEASHHQRFRLPKGDIITDAIDLQTIRLKQPDERLKSYVSNETHIEVSWVGSLPHLYGLPETQQTKAIRTTVVIAFNPFEISVFHNSQLCMVINGRRLFNFELSRSSDDTAVHVDYHDATTYDSSNLWSVDFGSTDEITEGPMGIGIDVSYCNNRAFYGLAEHAVRLDLPSEFPHPQDRNEPYRFWNLDVFEYELNSPMALYAAIPFLHSVQHKAEPKAPIVSGTLWLNSAETYVKLDRTGSSQWSLGDCQMSTTWWTSETGILDMVVMGGRSVMDNIRTYHRLTDHAPMQQLNTLGLHQCRWNYESQHDVEYVNQEYDKAGIPLDYIWLDIDYSPDRKYFQWNHEFSRPQEMVDGLALRKRNLVVIVDPHVKADSNYEVHQRMKDENLYAKTSDGSDYIGWCWPGNSGYPDFLKNQTRSALASFFLPDKFIGTSPSTILPPLPTVEQAKWDMSFGNVQWWNDMNEPSVFNGPELTIPRNVKHLDMAVEHRAVHNLYGLYFSKAVYEATSKRDDGRPFALTRSAFIGSHRYAAIWTGDNAAYWEHARISIPMVLNLAACGIAFSGADVGGFFKEPSHELSLRWVQLGSWTPFFRIHSTLGSSRREIYTYPSETQQHAKKAVIARYKLLPFWYTLLVQNVFTAIPMLSSIGDFELRHNANHFSSSEALSRDDGFLVGDTFFVRPTLWPESEIAQGGPEHPGNSFILPGSSEIQWWTWNNDVLLTARGGDTFSTRSTPKYYSPVFVRVGSIVATKERHRRSSEAMRFDPFTIHAYVTKENPRAQGKIYLDDYRSTKTLQQQDYAWIYFSLERIEGASKQFRLSKQTFLASNRTDWISRIGTKLERIRLVGLGGEIILVELQGKNGKATAPRVKRISANEHIIKLDLPDIIMVDDSDGVENESDDDIIEDFLLPLTFPEISTFKTSAIFRTLETKNLFGEAPEVLLNGRFPFKCYSCAPIGTNMYFRMTGTVKNCNDGGHHGYRSNDEDNYVTTRSSLETDQIDVDNCVAATSPNMLALSQSSITAGQNAQNADQTARRQKTDGQLENSSIDVVGHSAKVLVCEIMVPKGPQHDDTVVLPDCLSKK